MGQPIILRHSYTRNRDTARAALRYYQMRPRGADEPPRAIFGKDGTMTREEAYRLMDAHQAKGYLAHRLMLSPPEDARPGHLRDFTRHVLRELERDKGLTLHWIAVEHRNTAHPHVHVVLCGGGERRGTHGRETREVRLDRGDHARIKDDGLDYCRLVARVRDDWDRALDRAAGQRPMPERVPAGRPEPVDGRAGRADDDFERG